MSVTTAAWKTLQKEALKVTSSNIKKIYQKDGLLVISKPYNVPVHSGPKVKTSISDLLSGLEERYSITPGKLQLAHRLDKNTSGLLLLTYNDDMASYIAKCFHDRLIEKTYLAVLVGVPKRQSRGTLQCNISETTVRGRMQMGIADEKSTTFKHSLSDFRILDDNHKSCSLCRFQARTGLKHQIRIHASELLQCPVLGDHKYHSATPGPQIIPLRLLQLLRMQGVPQQSGKSKIRPWQRALIPLHLFAESITIPDSSGGEPVRIEAPIPRFFQQTLDLCDLKPNRIELEEKEAMKMMKKKKFSLSAAQRDLRKDAPDRDFVETVL